MTRPVRGSPFALRDMTEYLEYWKLKKGSDVAIVSKKNNQKLVEACERDIATLLEELESQTNSLVEQIEITDTETTTFESISEELDRRVVITLRRVPGTRWAT